MCTARIWGVGVGGSPINYWSHDVYTKHSNLYWALSGQWGLKALYSATAHAQSTKAETEKIAV